jgi:mannose-6-phosphate isomerase-like protein (cupin superfamily)
MNPFIFSKDKVQNPIESSHGEVVYELVGRPDAHGNATQHSLAHIVIPAGKASLLHYHKVCEETYYILQGKARMLLNGQESTLSPGQACLILPHQRHKILNTGDEPLEFLAICAPAWYPEDSYYD